MATSVRALCEQIPAAARRVYAHLEATPVERAFYLETASGLVFLKCEHRQPTGSFKVRGALNAITQLSAATRERGIITTSTGNHGMAVAWTVRKLGGRAIVYTHPNASPAKLARIRQLGAAVQIVDADYLQIVHRARSDAERDGLLYVPPYDDAAVIAGQGTAAVELLEQVDGVDALFVTVGGGGLIAGMAAWLKQRRPGVMIYGCLPESSPDVAVGARGGDMSEVKHPPTLSDGSAGSILPDAITIELCRQLVDDFVLVSEREIAAELRGYIDARHELIEGSAAVALAAFRRLQSKLRDQRVAIVVCGANISSASLQRALEMSS
jgi:threonine dehydratase